MSSTNTETPAPSRSAAREFYLCLELRQQLLGLLDKHALTKFIRVEKKCVFDVAKRLYQTMDYVWVRAHMTVSTPRQRTYCEAIETIDCRGAKMKIAPTMLKQTDFVLSDPKRRTALTAEYLAKYNPTLFNLMVPPMRKKCPGLRRMLFGSIKELGHEDRWGDVDNPSADSWVVVFDPPEAEAEPEEGKGKRAKVEVPQTGGRIDFHQTVRLPFGAGPPTTVPPPASPSNKFRLHYRFDLIVSRTSETGSTEKWTTALREQESFGVLYKAVRLGQVAVAFDDLVAMYGRQDAAGYAVRLGQITAPKIVPWVIGDFRTFAGVASTSLTCLVLHNHDSSAAPRGFRILGIPTAFDTPRTSYDHLPAIIEIVRTTLPNLSILHFALAGLDNAESVSRGALDHRVLTESGSVSSLRIFTPRDDLGPVPSAPFDTIRLVSRMCTRDAKISLDASDYYHEEHPEQARFLRHLWQQPLERRTHLAQYDFSGLGYTRLKEVVHLGYHGDGRPMGLWERKIQDLGLVKRVQDAGEPDAKYWTPKLERVWQECAAVVARMENIAPAATTAQVLAEVVKLRAALREASEMDEDLRTKSSLGRLGSRDREEGQDIRAFASVLKTLQPRMFAYDSDTSSDSDDSELGYAGLYYDDSDSDDW